MHKELTGGAGGDQDRVVVLGARRDAAVIIPGERIPHWIAIPDILPLHRVAGVHILDAIRGHHPDLLIDSGAMVEKAGYATALAKSFLLKLQWGCLGVRAKRVEHIQVLRSDTCLARIRAAIPPRLIKLINPTLALHKDDPYN